MPSAKLRDAVRTAIGVDSAFANFFYPILREVENPFYSVSRRRILLRAAKESRLIDWLLIASGSGLFLADVDAEKHDAAAIAFFPILRDFWERVDDLGHAFGRTVLAKVSAGTARERDVQAFFFDLKSPWNPRRNLWHRVVFAFYSDLALTSAISLPSIISDPEIAESLDAVLRRSLAYNAEGASAHDDALQTYLSYHRISRRIRVLSL